MCMLGSFLSLTGYPEITLDRWAKKYGSLYPIWLGNKLYMIISDPQVAKDLFQTNGAVFSSRAESYIKGLHVFRLRAITAYPYNDRWSVPFNQDTGCRGVADCVSIGASTAPCLRPGSVSARLMAMLVISKWKRRS